MFSSTLRLLIRTQCIRSVSTLSSPHTQHLLNVKPTLAKYLAGNFRSLTDKVNPLAEVDPQSAVEVAAKKERPKTVPVPKITLLDTHGKLTVCTLEEAEKLAVGRNLRLVQILDMDLQTKRPVYKLMTEAQYLEEELEEKKKVKVEKKKGGSLKGEKMLILSSRISEKDLQMKISRAVKWVEKKYEVRVTIAGPPGDQIRTESVYKEFEKALQGKSRFLQKRYKEGDLKFQLLLPKEELLDSSINQSDKNKNKAVEVDEEQDDKYGLNEQEKPQSNGANKEDVLRDVFSKV